MDIHLHLSNSLMSSMPVMMRAASDPQLSTSPSARIDSMVDAELTRLLYRSVSFGLFSNLALAALMVAGSWTYVDSTLALVWLGANIEAETGSRRTDQDDVRVVALAASDQRPHLIRTWRLMEGHRARLVEGGPWRRDRSVEWICHPVQ